jgi:4-hydroxyphenylpyruvate dioxygenase
MGEIAKALVNRFDHVEFATLNLGQLESLFHKLGFVTTQELSRGALRQKLLVQGKTRFLLTQGEPGSFAHEYARHHGDGVCSLAFHSRDAKETLSTAIKRGAQQSLAYAAYEGEVEGGRLHVGIAAIRSFGDVRATFVERSGTWKGAPVQAFDVDAPFGPDFRATGQGPRPETSLGMLTLDHLTNNVGQGEMEKWSDFYKNIYGWVEARYFDIRADQTGLISKVLQSPDGAVKIPINEPTEDKSQVQEFIDQHKGAGVQHVAMTTADIRTTVRKMRERGFQFLDVPKTYYDEARVRLAHTKEDFDSLQELSILIDGDSTGYLLQIFTQNQVGPLFFELIERKGHNGFGEGNFRALFEAIERDQKARGVL